MCRLPQQTHSVSILAASAVLALFASSVAHAQATFSYNFGSLAANAPSAPITTQPANVTFSNLTINTAGSGLTPSGSAGQLAAANFTSNGTLQNAINTGQYFTFTATPTSGNMLSITNFSFSARRLGQGPDNFVLRSSLNNFTTDITPVQTLTANSTPFNLQVSGVQNVQSPVEFRIYAYGAGSNASAGQFIMENSFGGTGTFQPVPAPPAAVSLGIGGMVGLMSMGTSRLRARRKKK